MAAALTQPVPLNSNKGALLSTGMASENNRYEVVLPLATDGNVDISVGLAQLVSGFETTIIPLIQAVLCDDSEILFCQAEAMVIGTMVPNREDFETDTYPGLVAGEAMPTGVGVITAFYGAADQPGPAGGIVVGKTFWAGISEDQIDAGRTSDLLYSNLLDLGNALGNGFADAAAIPNTWYRVASAKRAANTQLTNAVNLTIRRYTSTQRRRMLPH